VNRLTAISSVVMLIAGSVAVAQSAPEPPQAAPPESTPAGQYPDPGSTAPPSSSQDMPRGSSTNGTTKAATRAQIKSCVSEQRTNNPSMSKHDAKKYCETQLNSAPQNQ
jgi:hypothetical protein